MTGPTCPAEGCEYNENGEKTAESVRRHINAKTDDAHSDLEALRAALNQPKGTAEESGEGAPEGTEGDEQGEAVEEQREPAENSETEHQEMVSPEEYEQQQSGESSDSSGTEAGAAGASGADSGGESGGPQDANDFLPGFGLTTYVLIASALLAAFVIWRVYRSRSDDVVDVEDIEEQDDETSDAVERNEVSMLE